MAKRSKVTFNYKRKDKVNWKEEFRASHCINRIREILKTYWDEEYKLFKIKETIKTFIDDKED